MLKLLSILAILLIFQTIDCSQWEECFNGLEQRLSHTSNSLKQLEREKKLGEAGYVKEDQGSGPGLPGIEFIRPEFVENFVQQIQSALNGSKPNDLATIMGIQQISITQMNQIMQQLQSNIQTTMVNSPVLSYPRELVSLIGEMIQLYKPFSKVNQQFKEIIEFYLKK